MSASLLAGPGFYNGAIGILPPHMPNLGNVRHSGYSVPTPGASTIPTPRGTVALSEAGTHTARAIATTRKATMVGRVGYELAAVTANTFAEIFQATAEIQRNFGFSASFRIIPSDAAAVSGAKAFYGLNASTSAMDTTEISAIANVFGFGQISTSANMCLVFANAGAVGTVIDLGANFPAGSISVDVYTMQFYCPPDASYISWSIVNEVTGWSARGTETTNLPVATTLLAWHFFRTNGATALKAAFDFGGLDVWTEF